MRPGIVSRGEGLPSVPARLPLPHSRVVSGVSIGSQPPQNPSPRPHAPAGDARHREAASPQRDRLATSSSAKSASEQPQESEGGPQGSLASKPQPLRVGSVSPLQRVGSDPSGGVQEAAGSPRQAAQSEPGDFAGGSGTRSPTPPPQESQPGQQMLKMIQQGTLHLPSALSKQRTHRKGELLPGSAFWFSKF